MTDNKALTRFFPAKHIQPSLWKFCDQKLQFNSVLAHVPGVDNLATDYLSRLEIRPREKICLKLTDFNPVFQVQIDIASETPKQDMDQTYYYPRDEAVENIRKLWSNISDDKASGQKEHEHPTATENDVHQMIAHDDVGHRKTLLKDQIIFFSSVNTGLLPPRARSSLSLSSTVNLQVVQENIRDIKNIKAILLQKGFHQHTWASKVSFFKNFIETWNVWKVVKKTLCRRHFHNTVKFSTSKQ